MTKGELIDKLINYPDDTPVKIELFDDDDEIVDLFEESGTIYITNNEYEDSEQ